MSFADGIGSVSQSLAPITPAATPAQEATAPKASEVAQAASSTAQPIDHADLSSTGAVIAKALETSDTRSEKVEALRQAIASGSYNVPATEVANKIIESMLD
jgi:negative regulator of flagellin synthesis FlgM